MKKIKSSLVCLIIFSSLLPLSNLTAQSTTTLGEITEQKRQKELEKSKLNKELANPKSGNSTTTASSTLTTKKRSTKQAAVLTDADILSIQKRIDKKKADLAAAKSNNSLTQEGQEALKRTIAKEEEALEKKKKMKTLPVAESN